MKIFFGSDVHGSEDGCKRMLDAFEASGAGRLVLLGDLLYHGPRNPLPSDYDTMTVAGMLNAYRDRIIAVRGNCDSEVDQMVLDFPIMSDYIELLVSGKTVFATHGHKYNADGGIMPPLSDGDIIIQGHTHISRAEKVLRDGKRIYVLNPGSVSIPKGGDPQSYGILDEEGFTVYDMSGRVLRQIKTD